MVGEQVELDIETLTWNALIEEHFARHHVTHENVMAVLNNRPLVYENLPERGGSHLMIGRDDLGRILYISIRPTDAERIWEPVTGWESRFARRLWNRERGDE